MSNGYQKPNHTQTPNELFDKHMKDMKEAELRVVLAICRKTFGWHKEKDIISLSQLQEVTGMSKQGVLNGIEDAVEREVLNREKEGDSYSYSLIVNEVDRDQRSRPLGGQRSRHTKESIKDNKKEKKQEKKEKKTSAEILGPEILERTKKMRENSGEESLSAEELKKAAYGIGKEKDPLERYPPAHKDLLEVFCEHFDYPFPDQKKTWIKQVEVWVSRGYTPKDVEKACLYVESKDGWDVYQPSSIIKAFGKEIEDNGFDPAHTLPW